MSLTFVLGMGVISYGPAIGSWQHQGPSWPWQKEGRQEASRRQEAPQEKVAWQATDVPTDTPTPTPTDTSTPAPTAPATESPTPVATATLGLAATYVLTSGQPAAVVYTITAGEALISLLLMILIGLVTFGLFIGLVKK